MRLYICDNVKRMDFKLRFISPEDIPTVSKWLEGWGKTPIEEGMYPDTGLVLYDEESNNGIYMGFIWLSNSRMAQVGFITRNPFFKTKLPKDTRINFLKDLIVYAKDLGKEYVITWTENKFLVEDFKEIGLTESSGSCSELIAKI